MEGELIDSKVQEIAFGRNHAVAITLDGFIFEWNEATIGTKEIDDKRTQYDTPRMCQRKDRLVKSIVCGASHFIALDHNGDVYSWGRGLEGQTGHYATSSSPSMNKKINGFHSKPSYVSALFNKRVIKVSCGENFTVVLTEAGEVYSFGESLCGQLGHEKKKNATTPTLSLPNESCRSQIVDIACGAAHVLALSCTSELWVWGFNYYGQLGLGTTKTMYLPTKVENVQFNKVFAGGNYSVGITGAGQLYTWGNGEFGKLGHGETSNKMTPHHVKDMETTFIQYAVCGLRNLILFIPTWVDSIYPKSGPINSTSNLQIRGSGVWCSDELTVRFTPISEERLPRASIAKFDPSTNKVVCQLPKFKGPGDVTVEISVNGKHFTNNHVVYRAYNPPVFFNYFPRSMPLHGTSTFTIIALGCLMCEDLRIRFIETLNEKRIETVAGKYQVIIAKDESGLEVELTEICCVAPKFSGTQMVECNILVALNGIDFHKVKTTSKGKILFHQPAIYNVMPLCINIADTSPFEFKIMGQHFHDFGETSVYLHLQQDHGDEVYANSKILSQDTTTITCLFPSFKEFKVTKKKSDTVDPLDVVIQDFSEEPKWWTYVTITCATVRLSLYGTKDYVPLHKSNSLLPEITLYRTGRLRSIVPSLGPTTGGTEVQIEGDYFFDTSDVVAHIKAHGEQEEKVLGICTSIPYSTYLEFKKQEKIDLSFQKESKDIANVMARVYLQTPRFPQLSNEMQTISEKEKESSSMESTLQVSISIALDGVSFAPNSLDFLYYESPEDLKLSPSIGMAGTTVEVFGKNIWNTNFLTILVSNNEREEVVTGVYNDSKKSVEFKVPCLGEAFSGVSMCQLSLNAQQYHKIGEFEYVLP